MREEQRGIVISKYRRVNNPEEETLRIEGEEYSKIREYCSRQGITLNTMFQYTWHRELKVFSNSETTIVGMTVSGRNLPIEGIEESVGLYINTLPVVVEHSGGNTREVLSVLQEQINEVSSHSRKSLAGMQRDGRRLFNTLFVYENYPVPEVDDEIASLGMTFNQGVEKLDYPLGVVVNEEGEGINITIKYAGELFEGEVIRGLLEGMRYTVSQIAEKPEIRVEELEYIRGKEYERQIY
jgi:non-ribosomal peptide synthetase component F